MTSEQLISEYQLREDLIPIIKNILNETVNMQIALRYLHSYPDKQAQQNGDSATLRGLIFKAEEYGFFDAAYERKKTHISDTNTSTTSAEEQKEPFENIDALKYTASRALEKTIDGSKKCAEKVADRARFLVLGELYYLGVASEEKKVIMSQIEVYIQKSGLSLHKSFYLGWKI